MKHLKSYENTNEDDISKLKKYIVYDYNSTYYIDIIQHYSKVSNDITCKMIYQYYDKTQYFKKMYSIHTYSTSEYLEDVLFTSDNLEECFEFIKQLFILKKYNL